MANSLLLILFALVWIVIVTSMVLWSRFLGRVRRGEARFADLVPMQPRKRPFWTLAEYLLCFGAFLAGLILFTTWFAESGVPAETAAVEQATPAEPAENRQPDAENAGPSPSLESLITGIAVNSLAGLVAVGLCLAWMKLLYQNAIRDLGLIPRKSDVTLGLRASLWLLPPVGLISLVVSLLVPYEHPVLETLAESPTLPLFAGMLVGTALVAPLVEEFMFRVLLQGSLQGIARSTTIGTTDTSDDCTDHEAGTVAEATNELADAYRPPAANLAASEPESANNGSDNWAPDCYWPIVVTSLVFAAMHTGQGAAPIPLFVLSIGLGYLYRQTGRMTAPLVVHMVLNATTLCVEFTRFIAESSS